MASVRKRFGKAGLEWTDKVSVVSLKTTNKPDDSVFRVETAMGVKVCDLRHEYPVVFRTDPTRSRDINLDFAEAATPSRQWQTPRLAPDAINDQGSPAARR